MCILFSIIFLFFGLFAYSADNTSAWKILNSKVDSLCYSVQKKNDARIYSLADEVLDMLDTPDFKNQDVLTRTEIYTILADYKHSMNEIDNQYFSFNSYLCKVHRIINIHYDILNYNHNNILNDDFKENASKVVIEYRKTAKAISFINLMRAKVMMDFADTIESKPIKYFILYLIDKCFDNIIPEFLDASNDEKTELKAVRIISPTKTLEDLKSRYKNILEFLNDEVWFQQFKILDSNYAWFEHDFIYDMEDCLEKITDDDNPWRQYDEYEISYHIGYLLSTSMSEKEYAASIEFKRLIGDLYYAGTRLGYSEAWLLYIHNQFNIAPEETKANQEIRKKVFSIKDKLKDYDFAYWYGYDILTNYYDDDNPTTILKRLNCYAKTLMYRNFSTENIISNAKKLLIEYAKSQIDESILTGLGATHYIMWYRKIRDYALNFAQSEKEKLEGICEAYVVLNQGVSTFDNIDYSRYLSENEKTGYVEFMSLLSVKMALSPSDYTNLNKSFECYVKAMKNLGKPAVALSIKKLSSEPIDSLDDVKRAMLCINVLACMIQSVENKNLLNCNRLLVYPELKKLAMAVGVLLYEIVYYLDDEATIKNMENFYWDVLDYLCGPNNYNYDIVNIKNELSSGLKKKKQKD